MTAPGVDPLTPQFWAGRYQGPSGTIDFRGTVTHELGHSLRLIDIGDAEGNCFSSTAYATMCGTYGPDSPPFPDLNTTYYYRTLEPHDRADANTVYWAGP